MKKEYAEVCDAAYREWRDGDEEEPIILAGMVAERCEALVKPYKMLTTDECIHIWDGSMESYHNFAKAIQAAFIAKQSEPEVVLCRFWHYTDFRKHLIYCCTSRTHDLTLKTPTSGGDGSEWVGESFERELP